MYQDVNLFNAAIVGENSGDAFLVEGSQLHAVDERVAALKKDKSNPKVVLPVIRDALKALINFAEGKLAPHYTDMNWKAISGQSEELEELIAKIRLIYFHLPHTERHRLSSIIHNSQLAR